MNDLNDKMNDPNFWNNKEISNSVVTTLSELKELISPITDISNSIKNNCDTLNSLETDEDEIIELIEEEYMEDVKTIEDLKIQTYLSGEYDHCNCIFEIHSGAGGTEANDWANMLYRMYTRYFTNKKYKVELLDIQQGEEVGIKSVMLKVNGKNTFGYLKNEKGVHRLVRISPFDSNKRRHTSFASVEVTPEIDKSIDIIINDADLKIDIYRSSGPGGQGVNTTDSAVRITHIPTGIVVTCQNERSQIQNKEHCMEVLKAKLYTRELEKQQAKINDLKKDQMQIAFGSGKRSYIMCPYTLVKDNESGYETSNVNQVLDGELDEIIKSGLRM